jgi:hypothetical protein
MVPIRCVISVTFTMLPDPTATTAQAVWTDVQKLQGSLDDDAIHASS